jgi:ceramide glucosyltransferase
MMVTLVTTVLGFLLAGSLVYCILVMVATSRYLSVVPPAALSTPGISILKPLCGHDEGLEENLRSFFVQEYATYEILFGVHRLDDPAVEVAEKIIQEYSGGPVKARLIVTGESPIPNAKAYSLNRLVREAQHGLLVMCDSDVRVEPDLLSRLAREFENSRVGLITCPYRAVPGESVWSKTEALGMNTELLGGVMVARMLEGMRFALGCTIAIRREVLEAMGGFGYLQEFLAEDFVIGQRTAEMGHEVLLSSAVIQHRIGSQSMLRNFAHRLRWARSTRRSRPAGYWGQLFTYPLPLALFLVAVSSATWPFLIVTVALRGAAAIATGEFVVHDPVLRRQWWLLPLQDLLGFVVWLGGFLGDKIVWRDRKCTVLRDGRLHVNS